MLGGSAICISGALFFCCHPERAKRAEGSLLPVFLLLTSLRALPRPIPAPLSSRAQRGICFSPSLGHSEWRSGDQSLCLHVHLNFGRCLGLVRWPKLLHRYGGNEGKEKARKLRMFGPDRSCQIKLPGPEADRRSDQTSYECDLPACHERPSYHRTSQPVLHSLEPERIMFINAPLSSSAPQTPGETPATIFRGAARTRCCKRCFQTGAARCRLPAGGPRKSPAQSCGPAKRSSRY